MNVEEKKFSVEKLVKAFSAGSLLRNPEYQRGEAWSEVQKATFIDSLLRDYPVPALFLHVVEDAGLEDAPAKKFEVVDGQQRLTALRAFKDGKFKLLATDDKSKLRIPKVFAPRVLHGQENILPSSLQTCGSSLNQSRSLSFRLGRLKIQMKFATFSSGYSLELLFHGNRSEMLGQEIWDRSSSVLPES